MADVEQMMKIAPLITCEVSFGQHVCELIFGVNVFDLYLGVQINPVKQPNQRNSVGSWNMSHCGTPTFDTVVIFGLLADTLALLRESPRGDHVSTRSRLFIRFVSTITDGDARSGSRSSYLPFHRPDCTLSRLRAEEYELLLKCCAKSSNFVLNCSKLFRIPWRCCNRSIEDSQNSWSNFCDASLNPLIFCVWLISWRNCSLCWCDSNISINLATVCCLCSSCCWTVERCLELQCPKCCIRFPRSSVHHFVFPKILLLVWEKLAIHIANLLGEQNVVLRFLFGKAVLQFPCISLSQCILQAMCHGGWPHEILFGKMSVLSLEWALNCTNIPYPEVVSKYSCMARSLLLINRKKFAFSPVHRPSDSQRWRIGLFLSIHFRFRRDKYIVLQCKSFLDKLVSNSIETCSSVHHLLTERLSTCLLTNTEPCLFLIYFVWPTSWIIW